MCNSYSVFYRFVIKLVQCYEHKDTKPCDTSLKIIKELENLISKLEISCNTPLFNKIQESIRHVIYSFKAFLLLSKNEADADELSQVILFILKID